LGSPSLALADVFRGQSTVSKDHAVAINTKVNTFESPCPRKQPPVPKCSAQAALTDAPARNSIADFDKCLPFGKAGEDGAYFLRLTVRRIQSLTPAIKLFQLAAADGLALPVFTAGSHIKIKVILPDGRDDERHYSLINSHSQNGDYVIAVQHEANGRGGSTFMHGLAVGSGLEIAGPSNDFPLAVGATHHVLIAGGIGITPILSMANALRAAGQVFEFHYAARTPASMAFREAVELISDGRAQLCFSEGDAARRLKLSEIVGAPQNGRHVYVCGPRSMIDDVKKVAESRGWPGGHVHFESFGAAPQSGSAAIEVVLRRSGRTLLVSAQQSILDALLGSGIDHPHDCKRGECSTCQVEVIEGTPDNRDYCLFGPDYDAGKVMCVCVSRSKTARLVLDL